MTIFYAVVARGKTVLVEHTGRSGNFPTVARMILAEIPAHDDKRSLSHERYACQVSAIACIAVGHLRMRAFRGFACVPSLRNSCYFVSYVLEVSFLVRKLCNASAIC